MDEQVYAALLKGFRDTRPQFTGDPEEEPWAQWKETCLAVGFSLKTYLNPSKFVEDCEEGS